MPDTGTTGTNAANAAEKADGNEVVVGTEKAVGTEVVGGTEKADGAARRVLAPDGAEGTNGTDGAMCLLG